MWRDRGWQQRNHPRRRRSECRSFPGANSAARHTREPTRHCSMKRIAIIGGGISGLSAAYYLEEQRRQGAALEYILFESSPRLGGSLLTQHADGCLIEAGPDSFLTEKPWAAELCHELGIAGQLIGSNDADRKTYILVKGRLVPIPDGLM